MRFNTDQALFDAFPTAPEHIATKATGLTPDAFLDRLLRESKFNDAVSFSAYLLRRRDAVAWGCECLAAGRRRFSGAVQKACLLAAEAWVRDPSEATRSAAYRAWMDCDKNDPAAWLALAAAWSGGGLTPDLPGPVPPGPHVTASMVRVALILMLHDTAPEKRAAVAQGWIAAALRYAEADS